MDKVGRNDPCPCGSGKKYKRCHLNQEPAFMLPAEWQEYAEDEMVEEILVESERFKAYWDAERPKVGPVRWVVDGALPEGITGRSTRVAGEKFIRLRRVPTAEDEYSVAHELGHFLLDAEGFPMIGARRGLEAVASSIGSMVHDPLVHRRLREYGYEDGLEREYHDEISKSYGQLDGAREPSGKFDRATWAANYASKIVDYVEAKGSREGEEFTSWFKERFPNVAMLGEDVYSLVCEIGYDDPRKMRELFNRIAQRLGVRQEVAIEG